MDAITLKLVQAIFNLTKEQANELAYELSLLHTNW